MILQQKNVTNSRSDCLIAFGSNYSDDIGVVVLLLEDALDFLSRKGLFKVEISGFFQTPAFPKGAGPDFVNGVLRAETELDATSLLNMLHDVEATFGRTRKKRWEQRVLDLDLIDFGNVVVPNETVHATWRDLPLDKQMDRAPDELILPHPRVQDRPFVLVPMKDVAPEWVHPAIGQTVDQMLRQFSVAELAEIVPLERA